MAIFVIGLGPGDSDLLTQRAKRFLDAQSCRGPAPIVLKLIEVGSLRVFAKSELDAGRSTEQELFGGPAPFQLDDSVRAADDVRV